jgi:hypothetical protein
VQTFVPPVIGWNIEPRNCDGAIDELRDLLVQRQTLHQIVGTLFHRQVRIAKRQGGRRLDLLFRRWGKWSRNI